MTANNHEPVLERLVREVSGAKTKGGSETAALTASPEIKGIASSDYRRALRRCLSQREVREIVGNAELTHAAVRLRATASKSVIVSYVFLASPTRERVSL